MAAFQMVHVMEGVIIRGTATVLRDLNRPLFGKTGTTNGPTNVWFVGGTPDIVAGVYLGYDQPEPMGGMGAGRPHLGADLEAMGADRAQGPAQGAVRRAAGNSLGADRPSDRQAGVRRVPDHRGPEVAGDLGGLPAADRSRSAATQHLRRSRTVRNICSCGEQAGRSSLRSDAAAPQQRGAAAGRRRRRTRPAVATPCAAREAGGLPTQNTL